MSKYLMAVALVGPMALATACAAEAPAEGVDMAAGADDGMLESTQIVYSTNADGTWSESGMAPVFKWPYNSSVRASGVFTGPAGKTRGMGVCLLGGTCRGDADAVRRRNRGRGARAVRRRHQPSRPGATATAPPPTAWARSIATCGGGLGRRTAQEPRPCRGRPQAGRRAPRGPRDASPRRSRPAPSRPRIRAARGVASGFRTLASRAARARRLTRRRPARWRLTSNRRGALRTRATRFPAP